MPMRPIKGNRQIKPLRLSPPIPCSIHCLNKAIGRATPWAESAPTRYAGDTARKSEQPRDIGKELLWETKLNNNINIECVTSQVPTFAAICVGSVSVGVRLRRAAMSPEL